MGRTELIETISEATAEYGMQKLAALFPAALHAELREALFDLSVGALYAFADASNRRK